MVNRIHVSSGGCTPATITRAMAHYTSGRQVYALDVPSVEYVVVAGTVWRCEILGEEQASFVSTTECNPQILSQNIFHSLVRGASRQNQKLLVTRANRIGNAVDLHRVLFGFTALFKWANVQKTERIR